MEAGADDEFGAGVDGGLGLGGGGHGAGAEQQLRAVFALEFLSRSMALGTVMVTSTTVMPPASMALTTAWAWVALRRGERE